MVAVFVTVTAMVAIMAAMVPLFKAEFFKRDEITATALAQEGIELVRNVRDNNWKAGRDAFVSPFPPSGGPLLCTDYTKVTSGTFVNCADPNRQHLLPDSNGLYMVEAGSSTGKFSRSINVANGATAGTRDVIVEVSWVAGSLAHSVVLTNTLTDWGNK